MTPYFRYLYVIFIGCAILLFQQNLLAQNGYSLRRITKKDVETRLSKTGPTSARTAPRTPAKPAIFGTYIFRTNLNGILWIFGEAHPLTVDKPLKLEVPQHFKFYFFTEDERFITDDFKYSFRDNEKGKTKEKYLALKEDYIVLLRDNQEKNHAAAIYYSIRKNFVFPQISAIESPRVGDFEISKNEVTVSQFAQFVKETQHKLKDSSFVHQTRKRLKDRNFIPNINWQHDSKGEKRLQEEYEHPVVNVSWEEAHKFCQWLSEKDPLYHYRLPTAKEWDDVATCGAYQNHYTCGAKYANTADAALKNSAFSNKGNEQINDRFALTNPVGYFEPTCYGLYDIVGNVAEWVQDDYRPSTYKSKSKTIQKVHKGGSYYSTIKNCNIPKGYWPKDKRHGGIGFRLVRTLK